MKSLRLPSPFSKRLPLLLLPALSMLIAAGCSTKNHGPSEPAFFVKDVDPKQASMMIHYQPDTLMILDVRTPAEFDKGHIKGAVNIDFNDPGFADALTQLDDTKEVLLHCASGGRSTAALTALEAAGVSKIYHLTGGMNAWRAARMPITK